MSDESETNLDSEDSYVPDTHEIQQSPNDPSSELSETESEQTTLEVMIAEIEDLGKNPAMKRNSAKIVTYFGK